MVPVLSLSDPVKGWPAGTASKSLAEIAEQRWNVLAGDLPMPVMLLRVAALRHNLELMAAYCTQHGVSLAPHGKTTMSPELWQMQLDAGAWGITAATVFQAQAMHANGVRRVLLANEVVDSAGLDWLGAILDADEGFETCCLVDSTDGVDLMQVTLAARSQRRPLDVLVELGLAGGRSGCRTIDEAMAVAQAVIAAPSLRLIGVEAFEGVVDTAAADQGVGAADMALAKLLDLVVGLEAAGAFDGLDEVMVSAGGSVFLDRVVEILGRLQALPRRTRVVLRSGCYLTHDHGHYRHLSPFDGRAPEGGARLRPAIETWGDVLSTPEPGLAIVGLGKRDVPYDIDLPVVLAVHRRGAAETEAVSAGLTITSLNDQHAFVRVDSVPIRVGDRLIVGISHPCTAFDKWRLVPLVDNQYTVVGAVHTIF